MLMRRSETNGHTSFRVKDWYDRVCVRFMLRYRRYVGPVRPLSKECIRVRHHSWQESPGRMVETNRL